MTANRPSPGLWCVLIGLLSSLSFAQAPRIFPYDARLEVLANGLRVVTVPVIPSREISYFTIFRSGAPGAADPGGAAEAELLGRIGAETRRVVSDGGFFGDFISFSGREHLAGIIQAEAGRAIGLPGKGSGGAFTPGETILLIAGDINRDDLLPLIREAYSGWTGGAMPPASRPEIAASPGRGRPAAAAGPEEVILEFRGPAFSDREPDKAALDLAASAAFSPSSSIYRKLVDEEGSCLSLEAVFDDRRGPASFIVRAALADGRDKMAVEGALLAEIERLKSEGLVSRLLAEAVSRRKASLAVSLATTGGMARTLAHYLGLSGDPETIDRLFALYERITPLDVRAAVRTYLVPEGPAALPAKGPGR